MYLFPCTRIDSIKKMPTWHINHAFGRSQINLIHHQLHDSAITCGRLFLHPSLHTQNYSSQGKIPLFFFFFYKIEGSNFLMYNEYVT